LLVAAIIFVLTYGVVAIGRAPGLRLDRAGAALVGASLMVASGTLSLEEAYRAIDLDTLTLLFGMMIVVANLRFAGFFGLATQLVARRAAHPLLLLAAIVLIAGVLSAVLVNDTVCLMMTPLIIELAAALGQAPLPYLLALAMASNIGSTATLTGNPQNMMIGSVSHIPYGSFAAALSPVGAGGLVIATLVIALIHRRQFLVRTRLVPTMLRVRWNRGLLIETAAVLAAIIAFFLIGEPPAKVALVGGALLLVTRRIKPERIYREIDWSLLVLFAGLFVTVAGFEKAVLTEHARAAIDGLGLGATARLTVVAAVLSNLLSNVPAVLVLKPFIERLPDAAHAWLVLAMASTLAGNFTILGSVANLIVVRRAAQHGVTIGFAAYVAAGIPVTLLTLALGAFLLQP
jgi:Na+/H+ antiporter NhaD/arsenite permease-like protein